MKVARFEKVSVEQYNADLQKLLGISDDSYQAIVLPKRATVGSAGYDFVCPLDVCLKPGESIKIPSGIRCYIMEGYVLNIYPRSSLGFKYQMTLANTTGIIDSDYYNAANEGHIIVALVNRGDQEIVIHQGDRFVQGVFLQYFTAEESTVTELRTGGFGSSNK